MKKLLASLLMLVLLLVAVGGCATEPQPPTAAPTAIPMLKLDLDRNGLYAYEWDLENDTVSGGEKAVFNFDTANDFWTYNFYWDGADYHAFLGNMEPENQNTKAVSINHFTPCYKDYVLLDDGNSDYICKSTFTISGGDADYEFDFSGLEMPDDKDAESYVITSFYIYKDYAYFLLVPNSGGMSGQSEKILYVLSARLNKTSSYECHVVKDYPGWFGPDMPQGRKVVSANNSFIVADDLEAVFEITHDDYTAREIFSGRTIGDYWNVDSSFLWPNELGYYKGYLLIMTSGENPDGATWTYTYYAVKDGEIISAFREETAYYMFPNI